jgi:hypothetical protein
VLSKLSRVHDYLITPWLKLKLIYDRQTDGQSVLVSGAHLGPVTNFSFSLKFPSDSCGFVILLCLLRREDGSVIYCTIASGPCQSSHSLGRSPAELTAIFYCLIWDSPNLPFQTFHDKLAFYGEELLPALSKLSPVHDYLTPLLWVRERTIPTGRPPLVDEVSVKFCGQRGVAWSTWRVTEYFRGWKPSPPTTTISPNICVRATGIGVACRYWLICF